MINVLVVEDDPMVAALNAQYLQMIPGFQLIAQATNGLDALALIDNAAQREPINLLLLDVFMPQLNGLALLQKMKQTHPIIDIIMVTAARNTLDIQTALRLGVIDYIVKPFTFERLQTSLIAYQERVRLLSTADNIDQTILDRRILTRPLVTTVNLPKGIDAITLKNVKQLIAHSTATFSVNDLLPLSNLSRISLKKYLDYLLAQGDLNSHLAYDTGGRPVTVYHKK